MRIKNKDKFPILYHGTWDIWDSTKLKAFTDCPRMCFYEYILGWRSDYPAIHLAYGAGVHEALDQLYIRGWEQRPYWEMLLDRMEKVDLEDAITEVVESDDQLGPLLAAFMEKFDEIPPDYIEQPKTGFMAMLSLMNYMEKTDPVEAEEVYVLDDRKATEIGGLVQVGAHQIAFKMDALMCLNGERFYALEHKTGKAFGRWEQQWEMSIQLGTYQHALNCMTQGKENDGLIVNGLLLKRTTMGGVGTTPHRHDKKDPFRHVTLQRHHTKRNASQMAVWYNSVLSKFEQLQFEFETLARETSEKRVMQAFPMRESVCHSFYGSPCKYLDFCKYWPNPLAKADVIPAGFRREFWNPLEQVKQEVNPREKG